MNIKLCILTCYIEIKIDIHGYPAEGGGVSFRNVELQRSVALFAFSKERNWKASLR